MFYETKAQKVFKVFNYIFLFLVMLITLLPFWYVIVVSFNSGGDFKKGGVYFWPRAFTIGNYLSAIRNEEVIRALWITVFRTVLQIITGLFCTLILAYALSINTFPGRKGITFFFYFTTIFSGGLIPYYMLLRDIGLTKSFWLYVIPCLYNFFNTVLVRHSFMGIPHELREAAQIDGAGDLRILFTIYLPCSLPIIATIAMYIGVSAWNDWYTGVYYQLDKSLMPIASILQNMIAGTPTPSKMAYVVISVLPILLFYPLIQKYYVAGVMNGSVKG